jgi:hypothetical protein
MTGRHVVLCWPPVERERVLMRWFRSKIRFGSRLALFVLAVQIVLSFGHIHVYGFTAASVKTALSVAADQSSVTLPNSPSPIHKSDGSADFDCPICALIQLASTSTPSAAPALPIPAMLGLFKLEAPEEFALAVSPHFLFQARAPPSV